MGATSGAVPAGDMVALQVDGQDGVGTSGVTAVALTVTVTRPARLGQVTVYGGGTTRPAIPNLDFLAGQTVANLVITPVGADGTVDLYNGSTGPIQLVADTWGYYYLGGTYCSPTSASGAVPNC